MFWFRCDTFAKTVPLNYSAAKSAALWLSLHKSVTLRSLDKISLIVIKLYSNKCCCDINGFSRFTFVTLVMLILLLLYNWKIVFTDVLLKNISLVQS